MQLNTFKPAPGAKKNPKRVGRGIGCGKGKTCGRGHKGQKSRSGYSQKQGFEGGQMPLQRRVPKFGFKSRIGMTTAEVPMWALNKIKAKVVDMRVLKEANLINSSVKRAKVMLSGNIIEKAITLKGIKATAGAKKAIEAAGGKVE